MTATIEGLRSDWLWQMARVSRPETDRPGDKKGAYRGSAPYADCIRIEPRDGRPILVATDGSMLTAIHATEARCEGLDEPITLRVDGALRSRISGAGERGRAKQTVTIGIHGDRRTIDVLGARPVQLAGDAARGLVQRRQPYAPWRQVLPDADSVAGWRAGYQIEGVTRIDGISQDLLAKVPRYARGGLTVQPVWRLNALDYGAGKQLLVRQWLVREVDEAVADRCLTLIAPWQEDAPLDRPLPEFARAAAPAPEPETETETESAPEPEGETETDQ